MVDEYKSQIKFLLMYIIVSLIICLFIGKMSMLVPYYIAITLSSVVAIFSYFNSKICLDIQKNNIYKEIATVLGYLGLINFLYIIYNISYLTNHNFLSTNTRLLELIIIIIDPILFYVMIHNRTKKINIKNSIYVLSILVIVIYGITLYTDTTNVLINKGYMLILSIVVSLCCFLLFINNYISLPSMKKYLKIESINDLRLIILLHTTKCFLFIIYILIINKFILNLIFNILIIVNFIDAFMIIKISIRDIIKKPNQNLYNKYQGEKIKLQQYINQLENKNELMINYKNWFNESIMSIPEGIILCENKKITFVNNKVQEYLKLDNVESLRGVEYEDIVKDRSENKEVEGLDINNIKIEFNGNEFVGQELNLESLKNFGRLNMIIIKDINIELKLKELTNKLEEKNKMDLSRNELLSNLSHEFKTPVNIIYSTAQLQELNYKNNDFSKEYEYNALIKKNCDRLIRLINNFIDSTKFDSNIFHTDLKLVNIVSLMEDLTYSVINFARKKNISVIFDTEKEEIFTLIDIDYIERIILNLLSNAIKYNKINGEILVNIKDREDKVYISVKDTGIGITKEKLDKLFSRFERFDNFTLAYEEGTGIGLNIVKQMVDALAGEIKVESEVNKGTTFTVILPKSKNQNLKKYNNYGDICRRVELELSDI
ncbi:MAG: HAMP domain-containing sensor histidine kinase [Terrisporobacter sp.]